MARSKNRRFELLIVKRDPAGELDRHESTIEAPDEATAGTIASCQFSDWLRYQDLADSDAYAVSLTEVAP
jgi:hypothetical protein